MPPSIPSPAGEPIPPLSTGDGDDISPPLALEGVPEGTKDWQRIGSGGAAPPIGEHRCVHTHDALDVVLPNALAHATKAALAKAMEGHVLAKAELIGLWEKAGVTSGLPDPKRCPWSLTGRAPVP